MAGGVVLLIACTLPQLMPRFDTELVQQVCASIACLSASVTRTL